MSREAETVGEIRPLVRSEGAAASAPTSGVRETSEMVYRPGVIVGGRYQLVRKLGRGGMGEVWSARHVELYTEVALKFPAIMARGVAARIVHERFRFEAQIAAQLGLSTPHVVAVRDAGCDESGPFLVMEHVHGRTLRDLIDERGALSIELAATIVEQTAEALEIAHAFGVAHRDLKPSNLLLVDRADGATFVKIADFGIAKALRTDLSADLPEDTSGGMMVGSPAYMSPEQIGGGGPAAPGDLWALAVMAYEAVTGRLPFEGRTFADLFVRLASGRHPRASSIQPALPAGVDAFFARALAKDPARRFRSARDVAQALRRVAEGPPSGAISHRARRIALRLGLIGG
ncbi:serine/threonine protein kinase [Minicystis rosea]|nr:serine/threonine protein kinase [Minicystis rosea]